MGTLIAAKATLGCIYKMKGAVNTFSQCPGLGGLISLDVIVLLIVSGRDREMVSGLFE